jgi:hypothetical protein
MVIANKSEFFINLRGEKNIQFLNLIVQLFNQTIIEQPEQSIFSLLNKPRNEREENDQKMYDETKPIHIFGDSKDRLIDHMIDE